jgi:hypothetical protein
MEVAALSHCFLVASQPEPKKVNQGGEWKLWIHDGK